LSDSLLAGTIERAKIYDGKLFLLTVKSILVFDVNSGKPLSYVNRPGGGPGEYVSLYDMLYDKEENVIEALDMNGQKVLRYGFDGRFINEFKTPFSSFSFHKIAPSVYLFYNSNMISDVTDCKLIRYDARTSTVTASHFPVNRHLASYFFTVDANNFTSATTLSFHPSPSDTIYGFTDDFEPYARYVLNFGRHHTPSRFYKENYSDIRDFSVKAARRGYIFLSDNFCENRYMAALFFRSDQNIYWTLYDRKTQTVHTTDRWLDDFHARTAVDMVYGNGPFLMDSACLYFFMQPDQLIDIMEKENRSTMMPENQFNILDSLYRSPDFSEQSNPVLVRCKFKDS
jgi:hypothetical protein